MHIPTSPTSPISPSNKTDMKKSSLFYFAPLVEFQVEDTLYQIPREGFQDSTTFLSRYKHAAITPEGLDGGPLFETAPIEITDATTSEFDAFLKLLVRPQLGKKDYQLSETELASALKLASAWEFADVRTVAISRLEALSLTPSRIIQLARLYDVHHWIEPEIKRLVLRPESLSLPEAAQIGQETTVNICRRRDDRSAQMLDIARSLLSMIPQSILSFYEQVAEMDKSIRGDCFGAGNEVEDNSDIDEPPVFEPPAEERVPTPKALTLELESEPEPIAKTIFEVTSKANKKDRKKGKAAQKAEEEARRREEEENERKRQEEEETAAAAAAEAEHARIAEEEAAAAAAAAEAEAAQKKQEEEAALEAEQRALEEEERQLLAEQERFNQAEADRTRREEEAAEQQRLADEAAASENARRIAEEEAQSHAHAQAQAQAEAEAKAVQEAADAKAAEDAAAASAAAEAEATATGDADAAGDAEDEEFTKLEADIKKAEEEVEKAQADFDKAEVALAKLPAPKPKSKGKKPVPSAAQKGAERTVQEADGKLKRAKDKLEKAEKALQEYEPPKRTPPAPPSKAASAATPPSEEPSATGDPLSRAPSVVPVSNQPSLFDAPPAFQTGGEDNFYAGQLAPPPITENKKKSLLDTDDVDMNLFGNGSDKDKECRIT